VTAGEVPVPHGYPAPPAPRVHHDVLHGSEVRLDADEAARVDAKHRLVAEVRHLAEAVAMLDVTAVDTADLDGLGAAVAELTARVATHPDLSGYGSLAVGPQIASALDERSPISGQANPVAPPMTIEFDGVKTWASATYGAIYEGPPFHVHGGWVIAAFDELLGVAQVASGRPGMTGTITIRLRRPTPLGKQIDYEGWVDRVEGRKTYARGVARLDGEVLAEAEGVFIAPRNWIEAIEGGDHAE